MTIRRPGNVQRPGGQVRGEVELTGKVLVLKRIQVSYKARQVSAQEHRRRGAADGCVVARSLRGLVAIRTGPG